MSVENLQTAGVRSLLEEADLNENQIKRLQNADTDGDGFVSSSEVESLKDDKMLDVWAIEAGKAKAAEIMPHTNRGSKQERNNCRKVFF